MNQIWLLLSVICLWFSQGDWGWGSSPILLSFKGIDFTLIIYNINIFMWLVLIKQGRYFNSELGSRNAQFFNRVRSHEKKFKLHEKTMNIKQEDINKWVANQSKKQLTEKIVRESNYDFDVKQYVNKFNQQHKGKINLLDFTNYSTKFNDFKENPISKKDMDIIREFQKRKIDQKLHYLNKERYTQQESEKNPLEYQKDVAEDMTAPDEEIQVAWNEQPKARELNYQTKGWFNVDDDFVMILLERNISTKVTTLNRINYYRTVLFMGNGNGLISYGKSRALTPEGSMTKAIIECKKNIIALPLDETCTLPRPITSKFQDYLVYLRPCAGFNSWGHPVFSVMLALSGIKHVGFKTVHTGKNNYTLLHSFFKAVTQNTTPQQMAEKEGFKYYRRRFVRPLTENETHNHLSY